MAWISLIPLMACTKENTRLDFLTGFLAGWTANLILFFWLWATFRAAHLSWFLTLGCWLSLSAYMALYWGGFLALYGKLAEGFARPFVAAAIWTLLELLRSVALTGFPWALLAHTQAYNHRLIQISSITGALGLSFAIVLVNAAIREKKQSTSIPVAVAVLLALTLFGEWRLKNARSPSETSFRVALLQGNIDQYQKWNETYESGIRATYETLIDRALAIKPDLIVWPESAVPGWYPNDPIYAAWVERTVARSKTYHLIGAVTRDQEKDLNSAFLLDGNGAIRGRYDKRHLVPFGEYIPFGLFLQKWIFYLGQLGIFDAGQARQPITFRGLIFTVNICYEALFPGLIRVRQSQPADVIINLTNDGWFLDSAAPEQHYVANLFRAVENGRTLIRAANTGISAVIDAYGREQVRSSLMKSGVFDATVPVYTPALTTFFSRWGNWFAWVCGVLVFIYYTATYVTRTPRKNNIPIEKN